MSQFVFQDYEFDEITGSASFRYRLGTRSFEEVVKLRVATSEYDRNVFDEALYLAFILIGISYYKTFPVRDVVFETGSIDAQQATFLNHVYQEGLGQFASENNLTRDHLAYFVPTAEDNTASLPYASSGILSLQSGGKDSLLSASLLQQKGSDFTSFYISSTDTYPSLMDTLGSDLVVVKRLIDRENLRQAGLENGKNGHIPVTYIVMAIALLQAVLLGKKTVLTSVGHEGEEPREWIGDLPVNHQWAKTWQAEQLFAEYVARYISADIQIGSPLRKFSELRIAELFAEKAWSTYGRVFSSCNVGNYMQGTDNSTLRWCGECPKCANSYLLFAPFIESDELNSLFGGQNLFEKPLLVDAFKGLLSIDGVPKPFECVGETDELRYAYHRRREGYESLPFDVPVSGYDYRQEYPFQSWTNDYI